MAWLLSSATGDQVDEKQISALMWLVEVLHMNYGH